MKIKQPKKLLCMPICGHHSDLLNAFINYHNLTLVNIGHLICLFHVHQGIIYTPQMGRCSPEEFIVYARVKHLTPTLAMPLDPSWSFTQTLLTISQVHMCSAGGQFWQTWTRLSQVCRSSCAPQCRQCSD